MMYVGLLLSSRTQFVVVGLLFYSGVGYGFPAIVIIISIVSDQLLGKIFKQKTKYERKYYTL